MSNLSQTDDGSERKLFGDSCMVKATLAINAGSAATIKNTGAVIYSANGVALTKAALAAQSVLPTHNFRGEAVAGSLITGSASVPYVTTSGYVQPALTSVYYVVSLNAAGTVAISQGTFAGQTQIAPDVNRNVTGLGSMPVEPDGYTAIGYFKVDTAVATTFTPATTALDAAGVTVTYVDVARLPAL